MSYGFKVGLGLHPASCAGCVMHGCPDTLGDRVEQWREAESCARRVLRLADAWERSDARDDSDDDDNAFAAWVSARRELRLAVGQYRTAVAALDLPAPRTAVVVSSIVGDVCPTCGLPR